MHSDNHQIRKNRVFLIRTMIRVIDSYPGTCTCGCDSKFGVFKEIVLAIRNNSLKDYLSVSQDDQSLVSYARIPEDAYSRRRRVRTTLGKYIRRNFEEYFTNRKINDTILDQFVKEVMGIVSAKSFSVDYLCGDDIVDFYKKTNLTSCMTGSGSRYVKLYSENPSKVCLLVSDEIRALLWTCDDGTKVLDRAYPSGNYKINILREWAAANGYVCRVNPDKLSDGNHVELSDGSVRKITLKDPGIYPYMDTFAFAKRSVNRNNRAGNSIVVSNSNSDHDCDFTLRCTDGSNGSGTECSICGEMAEDGADIDGDFYCDRCYNDRAVTCDVCETTYDIQAHSMVDGPDGDYICSDCFSSNCSTCCECECSVWDDNRVIDNDGDTFCNACANKELFECTGCSEMFSKSAIGGSYANNKYCSECAQTHLSPCDKCGTTHDGEESRCKLCAGVVLSGITNNIVETQL